MPASPRARLGLEALESRETPAASAWFQNGVLTVSGDTAGDRIEVRDLRVPSGNLDRWISNGGGTTRVFVNGVQTNITIYTPAGQYWGRTSALNHGSYSPTHFTVWAGGGNDTVIVSTDLTSCALTTRIDGGDGDDFLQASYTRDTITGGIGHDIVYSGEGNDWVDGGSGDDFLQGGTGDDTLLGSAGWDQLIGADGNDHLDGGDHTDRMWGGMGDDYLFGGIGWWYDHLDGEPGNDRMDGGDGDDYLFGLSGADTLNGGAGNDWLYGGTENDHLYGGTGGDMLYGEDGDDFLDGNEHGDQLYGGNGNDTLRGGAGAVYDYLEGGVGNDFLFGDAGDDILRGGDGNDTLDGFTGNDTLQGEGGRDTFDGGFGEFDKSDAVYFPFSDLTNHLTLSESSRNVEEFVVGGPKLVVNGAVVTDIRQRDRGHCVFYSHLAGTARQLAARGRNLADERVDFLGKDGAGNHWYSVRLFATNGQAVTRAVTYNGWQQTDPVAVDGEGWVTIMEKAFLDQAREEGKNEKHAHEVARILNGNLEHQAVILPGAVWDGLSDSDLQRMKTALDAGRVVAAGTWNTGRSMSTNVLVYAHMYTVWAVDTTARTVTVRNPWGHDHNPGELYSGDPDDGLIQLTWDEFKGSFQEYTVSVPV